MAIFIYLLLHTQDYIKASLAAVDNCIKSVVPSLFCFIVLTKIFVCSGGAVLLSRPLGIVFEKLTGLPKGCAGVYLLSFLSGFPSGVIGAVEIYRCGYISKKTAERLCAVCNNTGPALPCLIIGAGLFANIKIGFLIYLTQIISSVMLCFIFKERTNERDTADIRINGNIIKNIVDSVEGSVKSVAIMCGYIIIFSVIALALGDLPFLKTGIKFILPYFEIISGCNLLRSTDPYSAYILSAGAISFGGLCVHMQAAGVCLSDNIDMRPHFIFKLLHGLCSAILAIITVILFKESIF